MALPEPSFVDRDPTVVLADIIARYETVTGKPLEPTQVERLIIDLIAYRETLLRVAIQEAAKQNLVRFARYPMIDFLAEIVGAIRLAATPAKTTMRWTLPAALGVPTAIPQGTRVRTKDGKVTFAVDADATIDTGELTIDTAVTATVAGPIGNAYAPGQVAELVDDVGTPIEVTNLTETKDGAPSETSERFKARLPLVLAHWAAGGPGDAYREHALGAHPDVLDVYVTTPEPGTVRVVVLSTTGVPSGGLLTTVSAALTPEDARPICDTVEVVACTRVTYTIDVSLTLKKGALVAATVAAAQKAAEDYAADRRAGLGRSLVTSPGDGSLAQALSVDGVHKAVITTPAETVIGPNEWADATSISVVFGGFEP